jgi:hypothetical protein
VTLLYEMAWEFLSDGQERFVAEIAMRPYGA